MIVLHELHIAPQNSREGLGIEAFKEEAACITENLRLDYKNFWQICRDNHHELIINRKEGRCC